MQPTEPQLGRVVLAGSERPPVLNAEDQGPADPQQEAEITVYLKSKKSGAEIESYVDKLSEEPIAERKYLSRQELSEWKGASSEDIKVEIFAAQYRLSVVKCDPGARTMFLRGKLGDLQQAFGVELKWYLAGGNSFRARSGSISLPVAVAQAIVGVFGLDMRPVAQPR